MKNSIAAILIAAMALAGCSDECRKHSAYTCDELEQATYNVHFYSPEGREYNLGTAQGLEQCRSVASSFASSKQTSRNSGENYVCCLQTIDSACAEKHR